MKIFKNIYKIKGILKIKIKISKSVPVQDFKSNTNTPGILECRCFLDYHHNLSKKKTHALCLPGKSTTAYLINTNSTHHEHLCTPMC